MTPDLTFVSWRNRMKQIVFISCFTVSELLRNTPALNACFYSLFQCFGCFPLIGVPAPRNMKLAPQGAEVRP
jgi:hypothetical protein